MAIADILGNLKDAGFFDFVLPWLLFFAIIKGLLQKSELISKEEKINSIIAAVIGLFIVAYVPAVGTATLYINTFGPAAIILSALLVLGLFITILGFDLKELLGGGEGKYARWQTLLVALILVGFAYGVYAQATGNPLALNMKLGMSEDTWTMILVLVFILLVVWFASRGKSEDELKRQGVAEAVEKQQARKG